MKFIFNYLPSSTIPKHSVPNPPVTYEDHLVLVYVHSAECITVWRRLNNPLHCEVMNTGRIYVITTIVVVSSHETHHALVRLQKRKDLVKVPGETYRGSGVGMNRDVTCKKKEVN